MEPTWWPCIARLTELLDIEHPIISAPMAFAAGGKLAAAVTAAGGLGMIGGGYGDADWLQRELAEAGNARVGCGFITWSLAKRPELLDLVLARLPAAVMLSFGSPLPFAQPIKAAGTKLICQVQNIEHVGADGVLVGSRFWASSEALVHGALQNAALGADGDATIRTSVVDIVRKLDWPKPFTARVMQTGFVTDWHGREAELDQPHLVEREMNRYVSAMQNGDPANAGVWVGEAAGLIYDVRPAADLLLGMAAEAERLLGATAPGFVG
jgi:nitronate monooxygenase